ncbi:MAG: monovalent cation/H(+) antiporter subunit G [Myxococcales bacterium]|nr:monovalent cation/H(+) antiporter subunit G [Myxococcales bacterium]
MIACVASIFVYLAAACAVFGALGIWLMRDPYQRLHYITLPAVFSSLFITIAVFLREPQKQAGGKVALAALVLFALNSIVTHATARAAWVYEHGCWPPKDPPPEPPK